MPVSGVPEARPSADASRPPELGPLLNAVTAESARALASDCAFLCVERREGAGLRCAASVGGLLADLSIPPETCAPMPEWREGQALAIPDYDAWPGRQPGAKRGVVGALLGTPIRSNGRVVGLLGVARARGAPSFAEGALALLERLADLAGIALENARLLEEAQAAREGAERLGNAARALSASLEPAEVYAAVVEELCRVVPAHSVSIQRVDGDAFEIVAAAGLTAESVGHRFDPAEGDGRSRRVVRERVPVIVNEAECGDGPLGWGPPSGRRSWMGVPLEARGRVLGLIALGHASRDFYNDAHAHIALAFAAQASAAMENARLYAEARASEQRYRELIEQTLAIVCTHDLAGVITSVNPAAASALGRAARDLVGRRLKEFLADPHDPSYAPYLERVARHGWATGMMHVRAADGDVRYWRYHNVLRPMAPGPAHVIAFAQDLTEIVRSRQVLQESEARLRDLAENTDVVMFVRQVEPPAILYVSPAYERIFGRRPDVVSAEPLSLFADVHGDDRERVVAAYRTAPDVPFCETYRILRPDGGLRWVRTRTFPVRGEQGDTVRVVGICEDVTAAQEAVRLRADLTRMLVHDLRSPIAGVDACLELLEAVPQTAGERTDLLRLARRNTRRVLELVNGLLEIDRLEQGTVPLRRARVEVAAILDAAIEPVLAAAIAKEISIEREIPAGLAAIEADAALLARAIGNLLDNAVKFTPSGGRVGIVVAARPGELTLTVADDGPGFEPDLAPRLFQRFAAGRGVGSGTGLGLAFCRLVVEAHGGIVRATAGPGGGAVVSLTLPSSAGA